MSERRALLDSDMYKISEEDSQDEEVLSGLSSKVTVSLTVSTEGNNNLPLKVKPVPPVKPAFLRKNPNSLNINASTKQTFAGSGLELQKKVKNKLENRKTGSSLIFHRHNRSSSATKSPLSKQSLPGTSDTVEWPSSNSSSSSENSGDVSTEDESRVQATTGANMHSRYPKGHSYKEMKRKKKAKSHQDSLSNEGGPKWNGAKSFPVPNQSETETDDEESETSSGSQSCSSCDNHRERRGRSSNHSGHYLSSDDNASSGSYSSQYSSTDHPDETGESDLEYMEDEIGSDDLEDEESLTLVTESEIQFWTNKDGSILFCEPFSENNSLDTSESINEMGEVVVNRKSTKIQPSGLPLEKVSIQPLAATNDSERSTQNIHLGKSKNTYSGKISRLLKRRKGSKKRQQENEPQELPSSSSKGKETIQGGVRKCEESKMKCKGNGSGGPEKVFRFKDEHEGEIRQVELSISSYSKHNLGRRATMVESLLGIIPSRFSSNNSTVPAMTTTATPGTQQQQHTSTNVSDRPYSKSMSFPNNRSTKSETEDKRIMVAGFIPDGPAARNRMIKIGDWLQQVNGTLVDFNNVNAILLQAVQQDTVSLENSPLKILLELQRVSGYTVTEAEPLVKPSSTVIGDSKLTISSNVRSTNSEAFILPQKTVDLEIPSEIMSNIAVLYISIVNTNPPTPIVPKEKTKDVIFAWPKESESRKVKAMAGSHGMFSTLYKLLRDVTGSNPISSRVMIDDEEMDVVFSSDDDGKGLLLMALSTTLSNFNVCQPQPSALNINGTKENLKKEKKIRWKDPVNGGLILAQRIMNRLEALLSYQFGSLSRAFRSTPEEKLQNFLTQVLVTLNDISEDFLFSQVPGNFLRVPDRIRCILDERLFSFETSDSFSLCYGRNTQPDMVLFNCLGSCVLYKGMVVTSHLEKNLASQFHGWWRTQLRLWGIKRNTLPCFWDPVRRLVVWQETFQHLETNELKEDSPDPILPSSSTAFPCYSVLLGLENYMLGFVLEPTSPNQRVESPNIGWIRRGLNCLLKILNSEAHVSLEKWISSQENEFIELFPPRRASSNNVVSGNNYSTPVKKIPKINPSSGPTNSILKNSESFISEFNANTNAVITDSPKSTGLLLPHVSILGSGQNLNLSVGESNKVASASANTSSNGMHPGIHDYRYHHGLSISGPTPERLSINVVNSEDENEVDENTTGTGSDTSSFKWNADEFETSVDRVLEEGIKSISVTKGNVLFDFLQIEHGRGIMLTSKDNLEGPFSVIVHNFRQSATVSHHILHKAANGRKRFSQQDGDKKWVSKALAPISEHGILFNCDVVDPRDAHKKKPRLRQVSYWVIGRIYPNQREVYVCFQDSSVAQNLLEIAFKLAYYSI